MTYKRNNLKARKQTVEFTTDELVFLENMMFFVQKQFEPIREGQTNRAFEPDDDNYVNATQVREKLQQFIRGRGK